MEILLQPELCGTILDIGGGGEGIIGRLYGKQVLAIDNSQDELDESPEGFEKRFMDATELDFSDESFDNATFFYSLMYMTATEQQKAIAEVARVVKVGGIICMWDCDIESAYPDAFVTDLEVHLNDERIMVSYGIIKRDSQSPASISAMCRAAGLELLSAETDGGHFCLQYRK